MPNRGWLFMEYSVQKSSQHNRKEQEAQRHRSEHDSPQQSNVSDRSDTVLMRTMCQGKLLDG